MMIGSISMDNKDMIQARFVQVVQCIPLVNIDPTVSKRRSLAGVLSEAVIN